MALSSLPAWLQVNLGFREKYSKLFDRSVASQFPSLETPAVASDVSEDDLGYLLTCGSILAYSTDAYGQDAALRIAQFTLQRESSSSERRHAAALILDSLANGASLSLATARELVDVNYESNFPIRAQMEVNQRRMLHTVRVDDETTFHANHFQRQFWDEASISQHLSVSAPTSVGKSFVLEAWIKSIFAKKKHATVAYIVPTRALISEVERDLRAKLDPKDDGSVNITSIPIPILEGVAVGTVYVFTQERLQIFANTLGGMPFIDLLLVDEAHKIGDGYRGVLLQKVVEDVIYVNASAQVIFASPFTVNPEVLLEGAPHAVSRALVSQSITVNQNLIWLNQAPRQPRVWDMSVLDDETVRSIGRFELAHKPTNTSKRLPFVALHLSAGRPGNIVYVNGAAEAEKTALQLFDGLSDLEFDDDLENLVQLCEATIHKSFLLNRTLRRGVAFHYGNMPLLVKSEIERLFSLNKIRFLVCTSTLVEGVNMSCRNIFIRGPKKGLHKKMGSEDFWNLAGRAGRWGKEFQGNIVCVDANDGHLWEGGEPPRGKRGIKIYPTTERVLQDVDAFIEYLGGDDHKKASEENREFEHYFSYLAAIYVRTGSLVGSDYLKKASTALAKQLDDAVRGALEPLALPGSIILRNPGISPILMNDLLQRFRKNPERPAERLLLADPSSNDALDSYVAAFTRISGTLSTKLGLTSKHSYVLALLVTQWLRGFSLARLIVGRMSNFRKRDIRYENASLIRTVMKDVEEIGRYQAPRLLSCYNDVLAFHLESIGRLDLRDQVGDIGALLELGLSQGTQVALMNIGLSRTAAVLTSEYINDDGMDVSQAIKWLTENDATVEGLPVLVKREVREKIESFQRRTRRHAQTI